MLMNEQMSNEEIIKTIKNLSITDLTCNTISINQPFKLGDSSPYLFGNRNDSLGGDIQLLILNNSKITNNSKVLWKEIRDDEKYKKRLLMKKLRMIIKYFSPITI